MLIKEVKIYKGHWSTIFPGYDQMLQNKRMYWASISDDRLKQFDNHHELIHESEIQLEKLYNHTPGKLRGTHLLYGSIRKLREAMADPYLRHLIRTNQVEFRVSLAAEARDVSIEMTDFRIGYTRLLKSYKIRHNFYGIAIMEDPIAQA